MNFPKTGLLSVLTAASLLVFSLTSCMKSNDGSGQPQAPTDIYSTLAGSGGYSVLSAAIVAAGYKDSLSLGKGPYTVFAPSDGDFKTYYNIGSVAALSKLSPDSVKAIVAYHVFKGALSVSKIPSGNDSARNSITGLPVYFTKGLNSVGAPFIYLNGTPLVSADYGASNGVIQLIAGALNPPLASNAAYIAKAPRLTMFNAAVIHCGLSATLGSTTSTVFAPTDSAFAVAGYRNVQDINNADAATLGKIISYHILPGRLFSSDFKDGQSVKTSNGTAVTIGLSTSMTIKGAGNQTQATVTLPNRCTTNGVVFVIDQLLKPAN